MATSRWPATRLGRVLQHLERHYGAPAPPPCRGAFEMILWEIVAYLADDAQRMRAFELLGKQVGFSPGAILNAPAAVLCEITRIGGSIAFEERADRLKAAAQLAMEEFGGDLDRIAELPSPKAKKVLMRFPMIGEPGAEKVLVFLGAAAVLALESNGLRALVRLGFGEDRQSYSGTYKSVREATLDELPADSKLLATAHLLLRRHGQELCSRTNPACRPCPVKRDCRYFQTHG